MRHDPFHTATGKSAFFVTFLLFLLSLFGIGYLVFARFAAVQFLTAGAILVTAGLIYCVLWIIDFCLVRYHTRNEVAGNKRIQNRLLIAMGMITVCTVPIRIAVFFIKEPNEIFFYITFTTLLFIAQISYFCFSPVSQMCKIKIFPMTNTSRLILIANLVIGVILVRLSINYFDENVKLSDEEMRRKMNINTMKLMPQLVMSLVCAISLLEFHKVWNGEFEVSTANAVNILALENGQATPNNRENVLPVIELNVEDRMSERVEDESLRCNGLNCPFAADIPAPTIRTKIDCKVCFSEYSETRIPRMLKECGHTICEECVIKLLDTNRGTIIFCPFCQTGTAVNGPASQLSKNYTVMDILDGMKTEV